MPLLSRRRHRPWRPAAGVGSILSTRPSLSPSTTTTTSTSPSSFYDRPTAFYRIKRANLTITFRLIQSTIIRSFPFDRVEPTLVPGAAFKGDEEDSSPFDVVSSQYYVNEPSAFQSTGDYFQPRIYFAGAGQLLCQFVPHYVDWICHQNKDENGD